MGLLSERDASWMQDCMQSVEEDAGESVYVWSVSGSTGTAGSLEPVSVTQVYTDQPTVRARPISEREVETSAGRWRSGDVRITTTGSYSKDALITWRTGTYEVIEGPVPTYVGGVDLTWWAVLRRAR